MDEQWVGSSCYGYQCALIHHHHHQQQSRCQLQKPVFLSAPDLLYLLTRLGGSKGVVVNFLLPLRLSLHARTAIITTRLRQVLYVISCEWRGMGRGAASMRQHAALGACCTRALPSSLPPHRGA